MLLYTSRTSGASPLELSVSSRTVCYSYFRGFFLCVCVPVFQFMKSEYPILIKSAKGRPESKHFKIGYQHSTEYISFTGTSCRTSGQKKPKPKPNPVQKCPPRLPRTVSMAKNYTEKPFSKPTSLRWRRQKPPVSTFHRVESLSQASRFVWTQRRMEPKSKTVFSLASWNAGLGKS